MSFTLTLILAIVLTVWFLASIMWGSIWFNLVTSSKNAKQQFLSEKARSVADRVIFMADGKILEQAPPQQFFSQPQHDKTRQFLGQILTSHHAH